MASHRCSLNSDENGICRICGPDEPAKPAPAQSDAPSAEQLESYKELLRKVYESTVTDLKAKVAQLERELHSCDCMRVAAEAEVDLLDAALSEARESWNNQLPKRLTIKLDENCIETIKRLTPEGGEEISFGGLMGGVKLVWSGK